MFLLFGCSVQIVQPLLGCRSATIQPGKVSYLLRINEANNEELSTASKSDIFITQFQPKETLDRYNGFVDKAQIIGFEYNWDMIQDWDERPSWRTAADTLWNLGAKLSYYAQANDYHGVSWYLRDTDGFRINGWSDDTYLPNMTEYCPRGVVGSSFGLRYSEFVAQSIKEICDYLNLPRGSILHGESAYTCPCSFGFDLEFADPDLDGIKEGCITYCSVARSPLTDLWEAEYKHMMDLIEGFARPEGSMPKYFLTAQRPGPWLEDYRWDGIKYENWGWVSHNTNILQDPMAWNTAWGTCQDLNNLLEAPFTRKLGLLPMDMSWLEFNSKKQMTIGDATKAYDLCCGMAALFGSSTNYQNSDLGDFEYHQKQFGWVEWDIGQPVGLAETRANRNGLKIYYRKFKKDKNISYVVVNPNAESVKLFPGYTLFSQSVDVIHSDISRALIMYWNQ